MLVALLFWSSIAIFIIFSIYRYDKDKLDHLIKAINAYRFLKKRKLGGK